MLQIPINSSFLDSCLETYLDTPFHTEEQASFLPITYKIIDGIFLGNPVVYKILDDKWASYKGFIASFYKDGQLETFGYLNNGKLSEFIRLEPEQEKGFSAYVIEYSGKLVPSGGKYVNGKSIEPPFIWGDDDIITVINFSEWVREEIYYVINSGFLHHYKNCL